MKNEKKIDYLLKLIAKSSLIVFFGLIISKILTYLYRIVIARYFGPEVYGLFSLAVMIVSFLISFAALGFGEGLSRFIPLYRAKKDKNKIRYLLKKSQKILLITSISLSIILFYFSEFISINLFHNQSLILFLKIFSFLIFIQVFNSIFAAILSGNEKINALSFGVNILQNIFKFLSLILFIFIGMGAISSVAYSYLFGVFSLFLFLYFYSRIKIPYSFRKYYLSSKQKHETFNGFFSYSWPFLFTGVIINLLFWIDTFAIGFLLDVRSVGIYNAAVPIALLLGMAGELFVRMFFPLMTKELTLKNLEVVKEISKQITKWIFIINLPLVSLMVIFPGVFINLLFGHIYFPAINSLRFLALGQFFFSLTLVSSTLIYSMGKSKVILSNLVGLSIINLILNFYFVPKYGINGAAFSTFVSLCLLSFLLIVEAYIFTKVSPFRKKMIPIFFISIIPTSIVFYLRKLVEINLLSMGLLTFLFITTYLLLIIFFKCFDRNDLMILKSIRNKIFKS